MSRFFAVKKKRPRYSVEHLDDKQRYRWIHCIRPIIIDKNRFNDNKKYKNVKLQIPTSFHGNDKKMQSMSRNNNHSAWIFEDE